MPSPTYGVVDSMVRANEDPISYGGRWTALSGGGRHVAIISNNLLNSTAYGTGLSGGDCFIGAKYGGNVEVAFTANTLQQLNNNWQLDIFFKYDNANPGSGYYLRFKYWSGGLYSVQFYRRTAGTDTPLGTATNTVSFAVGQELFVSALDDASGTMNCYANGTLVNTATDTTYKSVVGYVGVDMVKYDATTPSWNNMKVGGTITDTTFRTIADDATVGTLTWTNPSNVITSDNSYATISMPGSAAQTHYLKCTNGLSTSYPSGATFQGFTVRHETKAGDATQDWANNCKLVIGGVISGTNHSDATLMSLTDTLYSLGNDNDLWGLTPTAAQVNASDFGCALGFRGTDTANTLSVDQITLRIVQGSAITTTSQTITERAAIKNTTSQTISPRARVRVTTSQTIQPRSRIKATSTQTITPRAKVTNSTSQTIAPRAKVTATTSQTIQPRSRVKVTTTKTLPAIASIGGGAIKTIPSLASIKNTTSRTISPRANLKATTSQPALASSRIQITSSQTIQPRSRITVTNVTKNIQPRAKVTNTTTKNLLANSKIKATTTKTLSAVANILSSTQANRIIQSLASVKNTTSQTISPRGRIGTANVTRTALATAKITSATSKTVTPRAAIKNATSQSLIARSSVKVATSQTISPRSRVTNTTTRTATAVANIANASVTTQTKTVLSNAKVTSATTKTITPRAAVKNATAKTIIARGNIKSTVSQTVLSLGKITATATKNILSNARVGLGGTVRTITPRANIKGTTTKTILGRCSIAQVSTQTIQSRGSINTTPGAVQLDGDSYITKLFTGSSYITKNTSGVSYITKTHTGDSSI